MINVKINFGLLLLYDCLPLVLLFCTAHFCLHSHFQLHCQYQSHHSSSSNSSVSTSITMANEVDPRKAAFLKWRAQFPWAQFLPIDPEKLAAMPTHVLNSKANIEAILWKSVDPEPSYWRMQHWLEDPLPGTRCKSLFLLLLLG